MSANEKQALGMSLQISQEFIDNLAKDLVQESLIETLNGKDDIVRQIVSQILSVKVDKDGKVSNYSSDNKYTYLQFLVDKMIKEEVISVAQEVLTERRAEIREHIKKEMSKKATIDKFYDAFFSNITNNLDSRYDTKIEVNIDKKRDY